MRYFNLAISPLFFVLGAICFFLPEGSGHHAMHTSSTSESPWQFVSSMWFMYIAMGIAHMNPWYCLMLKSKKSGSPVME